MNGKSRCSGQCKTCCLLGACPEDTVFCDACGKSVEPDCGVEVETEIVEHGRHYKKTVIVCQECYEKFYLSDYLEELNF